MEELFHKKLRKIMDDYVHFVYKITREFPREELYGVTSQIRRAALSIILNYIEGFARYREKSKQNFFRISYASLKELKYLLHFALVEKYLSNDDYKKALNLADEIGAMLFGIIRNEK